MEEGINLTQGAQVSISTAEELKGLATHTNAGNNTKGVTFKLTRDITLNENVLNADGTLNEEKAGTFVEWETIGIATYINSVEDYVTTFKGIIDGNNKTISGIYVNDVTKFGAGFVSTLENGVIENLTIANSYIYGERFVGGFAGANLGGNIYNCVSEDNLIVGNSYRIGGIVGWHSSGIVKNSYNTSKVVSNTQSEVGGIIGHMTNGKVQQCVNEGEIYAEKSYVGEVVGKCLPYSSEEACYCIIIDSSNKGNIYSNSVFAAGILGGVADEPYSIQVDIINSFNEGVINALGRVGGICSGLNHQSVSSGTIIMNIVNSYNGKDSQVEGNELNGGIIGYGNDYCTANIVNVYNMGIVSDNSTAGGISGKMYKNNNLQYCYNLFKLSEGAGIIANINSSYMIDNCFNIDTRRYGAQEVTETNPGTIDSSQNLTPGVTINGTTYTTLLDALNAWVDANKSIYPELKNWKMGDNGYPVFVE